MKPTLTIGFPYAADRFGGSTASSLLLARTLHGNGYNVHILAHGDGRMIEEARGMGLAVTQLPALSRIPGYARRDRFRLAQIMAFRVCRAAINKLKLDIVHTNDTTMLRTWAGPCIASQADLVAHWRSNFMHSWSVEAALRVARGVIAVSHYSFEKLPDWVQQKTTVEYNPFAPAFEGWDRNRARRDVRAALKIPPNAALIGVFGNHIERKRTHVLADILAAFPHTRDGRPVYGVACGGRAEPYDLQLDAKIEQHALHDRLLRPGFVRPVDKWMSACDAVLAPAIREPLARNVLEAMVLEVPVIVSTDGGLRELIEDGKSGILCDPFDTDCWIASTRRIVEDPIFAQSIAKNGRAIVDRLTPSEHAARVAAVYQAVRRNTREAA